MSETKWTEGPWRAEPDQHFGVNGWVVTAEHAGMFNRCPVVRFRNPADDETCEWDAKLTAAAPDLYDRLLASNVALTAVLDRVGEGFADELRHEIAKNRAALSSARGEAG